MILFLSCLYCSRNSDGAERQMLLKHNLTVASDVMSACSSDEYSTPVEKEKDDKPIKEDIIEQEDTPCKQIQYSNFYIANQYFQVIKSIY